jgi:hypothetical protein
LSSASKSGIIESRRMIMRRIQIQAADLEMVAQLNDTRTANVIWEALPLSALANIWGDEIYFAIPVKLEAEDAQAVVSMGDLGYWPPGNAFCIFFGPTPASRGDEIRPASPVNVFGRLVGDPTVFKAVRDGESVTVDRVEP